MTPEQYFSSLIQSGTEYYEALRITQTYYPTWVPQGNNPQASPYGSQQSQPIQQEQVYQTNQPVQIYQENSKRIKYISKSNPKTFYAPLITLGLIAVLMFTPFLTFEHDELTNSEEVEACEFLYTLLQSSTNSDENVESDDLECPMNGYSSTMYSVETISNFDTDDLTDETSSSSEPDDSSEVEEEIAMFGTAMIMLFLAPIVYIIFAIFALISIGFKKYPMLIGFFQLTYIVLFIVFSTMGVIGEDDFEFSVHGNFTGIGMYLIGFAGIGYFIRK